MPLKIPVSAVGDARSPRKPRPRAFITAKELLYVLVAVAVLCGLIAYMVLALIANWVCGWHGLHFGKMTVIAWILGWCS